MLACRAMIVNIRLTAMSPPFGNEHARERALELVRRHAASAAVEHAPLGTVDFVDALQGDSETSKAESALQDDSAASDRVDSKAGVL